MNDEVLKEVMTAYDSLVYTVRDQVKKTVQNGNTNKIRSIGVEFEIDNHSIPMAKVTVNLYGEPLMVFHCGGAEEGSAE